MTGVGVRAAVAALLGALALAGCGSGPTGSVAGSEPPTYCTPTESGDDEFWEVVHQSCAIAQDGDLLQAEVLRQVLEERPPEEVAAFHRTFVEVNHALRSSTDVSDDICALGLGLGDDLSTDYRSWVVAHGQSAYDAVLADPEALRAFPDAEAGCGLGEPFGATALGLYLERTGLGFKKSGLPLLEVPARP
jgi:hypothetical protein